MDQNAQTPDSGQHWNTPMERWIQGVNTDPWSPEACRCDPEPNPVLRFPLPLPRVSTAVSTLIPNTDYTPSLVSDDFLSCVTALKNTHLTKPERTDTIEIDREHMVDRLMVYFYSNLIATPAFTTRGSSEHSEPNQSAQSHLVEQASSNQSSNARSRKRSNQRPEDEKSDNGDPRPPKRPSNEKLPSLSRDSKRKFGCPYSQRNWIRYRSRRACMGPGFSDVSRVKEHLIRAHLLPIFCNRCYETFDNDNDLCKHQRAKEPCTRRPEEAIEGVNESQGHALKSRKKKSPDMSEEEKWREVYRILFPQDDAATIPSPYVDENWETRYQSDTLARYEVYLREELPTAVRRELDKLVQEEVSSLEDQLKDRLVHIIRESQVQLFRSFTNALNDPASMDHPRAGSAPSNNTIMENASVLEPDHIHGAAESAADKPIASSHVPPATTLPDTAGSPGLPFDYDPILFHLPALEDPSDSGYGSLFDQVYDWHGSQFHDNGEGPSNTQ